MKGPSWFDVVLQRVVIICYCIYININKWLSTIYKSFRFAKRKITGDSRFPVYFVPITKGMKLFFIVLAITCVILYAWNYLLLGITWDNMMRFNKVDKEFIKQAHTYMEKGEILQDMLEKRVIQVIIAVGDFTPISYLTVSSLLRKTIEETGENGEVTTDTVFPYVFVGSSLRIYKERESFHNHFGVSLGNHSIGTKKEELIYQWVHSMVTTSLWIHSDFNLTEVIEHYENNPKRVRPMIFVDFDVLSALCLKTLRDTKALVPNAKLFAVATAYDNDRVLYLMEKIYEREKCVCFNGTECHTYKSNLERASILFGSKNCYDLMYLEHQISMELKLSTMCRKENKGEDLFLKCHVAGACYEPREEKYQVDDCKWREYTIALTRQNLLFKHFSTVFTPSDMFIVDLESYVKQPNTLVKQFEEFLLVPKGSIGKVHGTHSGSIDPHSCLRRVTALISSLRRDFSLPKVPYSL